MKIHTNVMVGWSSLLNPHIPGDIPLAFLFWDTDLQMLNL